MSLSLSKKAVILVTVPMVFEISLVTVLASALHRAEEARQQENRARELSSHLNNIMSMHLQRTAFLVLSNNAPSPIIDQKINALKAKMYKEFLSINKLAGEDPGQKDRWQALMVLANNLDATFTLAKLYYSKDNKEAAAIEFARVQGYLQQLIKLSDSLNEEQAQLLNERHQELLRSGQAINYALAVAVLGSMAIAFGLLVYFNRGTADRLRALMKNTQLLAVGKAPQQALDGDDELAEIDNLYHKMHASLTNLRERERTILDNAAEIICSIDTDLRFSDVNNAVQKIWGYSSQDLLGKRVVDCIYKDDQKNLVNALREAAQANKSRDGSQSDKQIRVEARVNRADGTISDTEWSASYSEQTRTLCCVIHDISERKEIDRLKQEFVAMVSHDLRAPLTSIQMVHSMIEQDLEQFPNLSPFTHKNLGIAQDNINRLMALINNLLDLEKLESGMMTLLPEQEELDSVVKSAVSAVSGIAQQNRVTVRVDVDDEMSAYFDAEKVIQVLVNLLSNAFKFSPADSMVLVSAAPSAHQNGFIRLSIRDQGRGVPAHMQEQIFERFRQTDQQDGRNHKGSGLGLSICKAIIEQHHGHIGVKSEEGKGSEFWFTLPLNQKCFTAADTNNRK
jgi:PAS domain S-box-containing protein